MRTAILILAATSLLAASGCEGYPTGNGHYEQTEGLHGPGGMRWVPCEPPKIVFVEKVHAIDVDKVKKLARRIDAECTDETGRARAREIYNRLVLCEQYDLPSIGESELTAMSNELLSFACRETRWLEGDEPVTRPNIAEKGNPQ